MPNCKFCGQPVKTAKVFHPVCWETAARKAAEEFCDEYCRFPRECEDQDGLELHCEACPVVRLLGLGQ